MKFLTTKAVLNANHLLTKFNMQSIPDVDIVVHTFELETLETNHKDDEDIELEQASDFEKL